MKNGGRLNNTKRKGQTFMLSLKKLVCQQHFLEVAGFFFGKHITNTS